MDAELTIGASTFEPFDYGAMPSDIADEAKSLAERVRARTKALVIDTGRDLLAMKDRLEHGLFLRWVASELGMQPRTAQNYMQTAAAFGAESETVSHLPPTTLYALSAPNVPAPFRKKVVARLKAGEKLHPASLVSLAKRAAGQKVRADSRRSHAEQLITHRLKSLSTAERKALDTPAKRRARAEQLWEQDRQRREARQTAELNRADLKRSERNAREAEIALFIRDRMSAEDLAVLVEMFALLDEQYRPGPITAALRRASSNCAA